MCAIIKPLVDDLTKNHLLKPGLDDATHHFQYWTFSRLSTNKQQLKLID